MLDDCKCSSDLLSPKPTCLQFAIAENGKFRRKLNREEVNLETFQLVWLDPDFNKRDVTLERLRQIIDNAHIFNNITDCLQCLHKTKNTIKTFLICTEKFGQELFSQLSSDEKKSLNSYIYSEEKNRETISLNAKDRTFVGHQEFNQLLTNLEHDVQQYIQNESRSSFCDWTKQENSMDQFSNWWESFIKLLSILSYPSNYHEICIETLKDYYQGNPSKICQLQQFQSEYQPKNAILWFTRDTFLFRLLNQALRQHNIELLFLFGFYLRDFYQQMQIESENFKQIHLENPHIKLYRGQMVQLRELKEWSVGKYLINNSFLSTTFDRTVASLFHPTNVSPTTDELQSILFQFEIDVRQQKGVNPYADISHLSQFPEEHEVLFMPGSPFQITQITFDHQYNVWIIQLELALNIHLRSFQSFDSTNYTQRRLLKNFIDILPVGIYRASMDEINVIFDRLINLFPLEEHWITATRLHCLAIHAKSKQLTVEQSLLLHDQAIEKWQEYLHNDNELNCSFNIAELNTSKGVCYFEKLKESRIDLAEKHFDLAINYFKRALENNVADYERATILERLAVKFKWKTQFSKQQTQDNVILAIQYQELAIETMSKCDPQDIKTGHRLRELAQTYKLADDFDCALTAYEKALKYYFTEPKLDVDQICYIYKEITDIYIDDKQNYQEALNVQLIYHQYKLQSYESLPINSKDNQSWIEIELAESYEKLADIYIELNECHLAIEHLLAALKLNQEINCESCLRNKIIASIQIRLADTCLELQQYDIAYDHLNNALKLYQALRTESLLQNINDDDDDTSTDSSSDEYIQNRIEELEEKINEIHKILWTKQVESIESNQLSDK